MNTPGGNPALGPGFARPSQSGATFRAAPAVAMIAPVLAAAALRFLSDAGPATAPAAIVALSESTLDPAANSADAAAATGPGREPMNVSVSAAIRARQWLSNWTVPPDLTSPMLHPSPAPEEAPAPAPEIAPAPTPPPAADPTFTVTSILGAGQRAMASINGRVCRIGDEPAPGWRITAIDPVAKKVEIAAPDGRTIGVRPRDGR